MSSDLKTDDDLMIGWVVTPPPKPLYAVHIAPGFIYETHKQPNAWHRFWVRVLLGWVWRRKA